jgi:hypothetical protein
MKYYKKIESFSCSQLLHVDFKYIYWENAFFVSFVVQVVISIDEHEGNSVKVHFLYLKKKKDDVSEVNS